MTDGQEASILSQPCLAGFSATTRQWLANTFVNLTPPQMLGWPVIQRGDHTLIISPTGSGKTLAAFLAAIDEVMFHRGSSSNECSILYISPLKALAADVQRNLREPLNGVAHLAEANGAEFAMPRVSVRTGDTPVAERNAFLRRGADILITTPESLFLLLQGRAAARLKSVRWVIVDEIHTLAGSKRGAHLALSLERLEQLTAAPFQRIGLTATVRPVKETARFLGGYMPAAYGAEPTINSERPVTVVNAHATRDLQVEVQMAGYALPTDTNAPTESAGDSLSALAQQLLDLINGHTSTLIFANSRRMAERLAAAVNLLAGEELVLAHHGSVAREKRLAIEQDLKNGALSALIATSSLELGIDIGSVDLVVQIDAPPGVASALQRIGRASHQVGRTSHGILVARFRGDLPACAALPVLMRTGAIEPLHIPRNPLDVLAQHIAAMAATTQWPVDELYKLVRCAAPFHELPVGLLSDTLDMLAGRFPSAAFSGLRARIVWDRQLGIISGRSGTGQLVIANAGTIPDRGLYGVYLTTQQDARGRLGELDEEMVFECRVGDVFMLGASSWRIDEISRDRVLVSPAAGRTGRMPFWHGDRAGRHVHFGRAIGELAGRLASSEPAAAVESLCVHHGLDEAASRSLVEYLAEQVSASALPTDKRVVIESSRNEAGEWRVCILSPLGSRVHAPLAMGIAARVSEITGFEPDVLWFDHGIILRLPDTADPPDTAALLPDPADLERLLLRHLCAGGAGARAGGQGAPVNNMVATRFREAAGRALMLPRRRPGARSPLWLLRKRAIDLLQAASEYPDFPLLLEVFREILQDDFDVASLNDLLRGIEDGEIEVVRLVRPVPSPFASALLFSYIANFIYEGDVPAAERKAQALQIDHARLRSLMGADEVRSLLDPEVIELWQAGAQHLAADRLAVHPDGLHDVLLDIGDLTNEEVRARCAKPLEADAWMQGLHAAGRVVGILLAGEPRWIAVEDAARYRDGLGTVLPPGIPKELLTPVREPLQDLLARYARTHGPFQPEVPAHRFGLPAAAMQLVLQALATRGRVTDGEFLPGSTEREWCDTRVLRTIRYRTLEQLRREIQPVSSQAYVRMQLEMHGVVNGLHTLQLHEVLGMLQGFELPASLLDGEIFARRVQDYRPDMLDSLVAAGEVVWIAARSLGAHDGMVRLYFADDIALLAPRAQTWPNEGSLQVRICEFLRERGASFFARIAAFVGGFPAELSDELWSLVWAGLVTNDSLQPLRSFTAASATRGDRYTHATRATRPLRAAAKPVVSPQVAGRWSLVEEWVGDGGDSTNRSAAILKVLLKQHGLITRELVASAGIAGGFTGVYPLLTAMEQAGKLRRGSFVEGLGGLQFALAEAVETLRRLREPGSTPQAVVLSACDPANPYGVLLPWPATSSGRRVSRAVGASVVLVDGHAAAWLNSDGSQLHTFSATGEPVEPARLLQGVAGILAAEVEQGKRRAIHLVSVDGTLPAPPLLHEALLAAGFRLYETGYQRRRD